MMWRIFKVGFVGNGADKFTSDGALRCQNRIYEILKSYRSAGRLVTVVSGHSPMGGVDIWAEELALKMGFPIDIKTPKQFRWNAVYGFKQRNLDIAKESVNLHVLVADKYPDEYVGRRFPLCYHCGVDTHVKSGACWTALRSLEYGNSVYRDIISNYPT